MKIAYNPKTEAALTVAPSNNDITFDLPGQSIYVKGVKFDGKAYSIFKKYTSATAGGYNGLVPAPSYNDGSTNRFLKEDGTWGVPEGVGSTIVSSTASGLAPKIGTEAASTVTTQADEWVLTSTKGAAPTWRKLPTNAFLNYYRPILVNGTSFLGNNNTALNIAAGNNINLTTDAGKVTIHSNITNITGNAATADKLKTKVNLWGQNFDGSSDVNGTIYIGKIHSQNVKDRATLSVVSNTDIPADILLGNNSTLTWALTARPSEEFNKLQLVNQSNYFRTITITQDDRVGIGIVSPSQRLDVNGNVKATTFLGNLDWSYITNKPSYYDRFPTLGHGVEIPSNADLNTETYLNKGNYYCRTINVSKTLQNCPVQQGFLMSVYYVGNYVPTSNYQYRVRKITTHKGEEWIQEVHSADISQVYTYGPWKKTARTDDTYPTNQITALTGYTKATSASDLIATDTLNIALGKLEYKADVAYSWYRTITEDDTDEIINKWDEVVDFVNNLEVDLTEEFVTRKTNQTITGQKTFSSPDWGQSIIIHRNQPNADAMIQFSNKNDGILGYIGIGGSNSESSKLNPYWSNGTNAYKFWHTGNLTKLSQLTNDLGFVTGGPYLPLTGGTITGNLIVNGNINFTGYSSTLSSHLYRYIFDDNGNVYDHFGTSGTKKNTFANLRVFKTDGTTKVLRFGGDGTFTWDGKNVLHSGNYLDYVRESGYIGSNTSSLASYWGKIWDYTQKDANDTDLTFYIHSAYNQKRGFVHIRTRRNSSTTDGVTTYNMTVALTQVSGNIPEVDLRLYYNNDGYVQLWCDCHSRWGVYNCVLISCSDRFSKETPLKGTLYTKDFPAEQTLPTDSYINLSNIISPQIYVGQHTTNDIDYPLVWSNQANSNGVTCDQLRKSFSHLTYNPKHQKITVSKLHSTGQLILSAATEVALRYGNTDATSVVLANEEFRPYVVASSKINLGNSSVRWKGLYAQTGNFSGDVLVSGALKIGSNSTRNYIAFRGTTADGDGAFNHTYIGENIYNSTEASELVLFKGNDNAPNVANPNNVGPDRIRYIAAGHLFQIYRSPISGTFESVCTSTTPINTLAINSNDITSYLNVLPSANNTSNLGSSSLKWANIYATTFIGSLTGNASTATNSDKLDGFHETDFFRFRGDIDTSYVDIDVYTSGDSRFKKINPGTYSIPRSGYSEMLISFAKNTGSTSSLELKTSYENNNRLFIRKTIDANRISGAWKALAYYDDITEALGKYYWANIKISGASSTSTSPTFAIATATTSVSTPLLSSPGRLTLNATNTGVDLKFNNDDTKSVILNGNAFKPFDNANNKLTLGSSSARWSNVYSVLGNFSGDQTLYGLTSTCNKANGTGYMDSALQIREYNFGGSQTDTWGIAPRLSWHWSGRVQTQIGLSSDGNLYLSKDGFSTKYKLVYETGTWGINISGNAATATNADKLDGYHAQDFLRISKLANSTDINTLTDNLIYYGDTDANSSTMTNTPYTTSFAMIQLQSYTNGNDIRRNRIAFDSKGTAKLFNDRSTSGTGGVWYNILTDNNYYVYLDNRYYTETEINNKLAGYLPLAGGTMSSGTAQIQRAGSSTSWYQGRTNAMIRINSYSGYNAIASMKTTNGDWSMGVHSNNVLYFTYITDTNFNASTNTTTAQVYINAAGNVYATHFYEHSDINLKTNIKPILTSDNIPQLKSFDWKSDGSHSYGLIAQELEEQGYSELVSDEGGQKTVKYSAALSLIVGKLQVKIRELEKEIENLKNKN